MQKLNLGELPDMLGVELRIAQIQADRAFKAIRSAEMPSGHYTVLALIGLNPGLNQSALARSMHLDRSSMVPILDSFQRNDWTERRRIDGDRRAYAIYLTDKGQAVLASAEKKVRVLESHISQAMGQSRRDDLLALLKEFQAIITEIKETEA